MGGQNAYKNGSFLSVLSGSGTGSAPMYIGAARQGGSAVRFLQVKIAAFVLYDEALTADQMAAVAAAMAEL